MLNRGVFIIKIKKKYDSITYYKNKVPIRSFLAEINFKSKTSKKLRIKLRVAGKIGQSVLHKCLPDTFFLTEGNLSLAPFHSINESKRRTMFELNVYKLYPMDSLSKRVDSMV